MSRDWLVTADDRTGALEVAAEVAAAWGGPVVVSVHPDRRPGSVVDLGSRRCDPAEAAARAATSGCPPTGWRAHKIDSTLRGNWVAELEALQQVSGRRILLMAAWPEMGRTCVDGVVCVHGAPIADLRGHVPGLGVLRTVAEVRRWLGGDGSSSWAACDVADTAAMLEVASLVGRHESVLVAGPAGPLGAVFAAWHGRAVRNERRRLRGPALVVCGSATPVAGRQVSELRRRHPEVEVLSAPSHGGGELDPEVAVALATEARRRVAEGGHRTVVLVGGDTAAAFLGDAPRSVGGTVLPGLPWSVGADTGVVVVTKAGAFGDDDTLVRIFDQEWEA